MEDGAEICSGDWTRIGFNFFPVFHTTSSSWFVFMSICVVFPRKRIGLVETEQASNVSWKSGTESKSGSCLLLTGRTKKRAFQSQAEVELDPSFSFSRHSRLEMNNPSVKVVSKGERCWLEFTQRMRGKGGIEATRVLLYY